MAHSTYSSNTLLGNYMEEHSTAPKLNGVLPDYGKIDYSTTNKSDLKKPQKSRHYRPETHNSVHHLITVEYIEEMALASTNDPDAKFADVLARADPKKAPDSRTHYETSTNASFGARPARKGRRAAALAAQQESGAKLKEGEKAVVPKGAYGERLREDADPMHDTRAQRSWVYGGASMFTADQQRASNAKAVPRPKAQATSLDTRRLQQDGEAQKGNHARSSTSITQGASRGLAKRGGGVWADY